MCCVGKDYTWFIYKIQYLHFFHTTFFFQNLGSREAEKRKGRMDEKRKKNIIQGKRDLKKEGKYILIF